MPLLESLIKLLPEGLYWQSKNNIGSALHAFLDACVQLFQSFEGDLKDAFTYVNPLYCPLDWLETWEEVLGLPESCAIGVTYTIDERRRIAYKKLTQGRIATIAELEDVAHQIGFDDVAITEYGMGLVADGVCDTPCYSDVYIHGIKVESAAFQVTSIFRAGSLADEPLAVFRDTTLLRCTLEHLNPAHSFYIYEES
jgi:uncharacterized protein YmfQ (DUF2313 family)